MVNNPAALSWNVEGCSEQYLRRGEGELEKKMNVVAINGSPRKQGNTDLLLRAVLQPLTEAGADTELVELAGHDWPADGFAASASKASLPVPPLGCRTFCLLSVVENGIDRTIGFGIMMV